jgi:hypothetical protein
MAQEKRSVSGATENIGIGTGPYLARIVSHLDPTFMGGLEVTIFREQGNSNADDTQTYNVRCASPFFGYTGFEFQGDNSALKSGKTIDAYNDSQKSYGMWMVPPDIGVTVLVVFVDGDPSQGYWIGCIPARFSNNMVPAIGGSDQIDIDKADKDRYGITKGPEQFRVKTLPVTEINKRLNAKEQKVDPEKIPKPVHPLADVLLEQGLLLDDARGVTTTSARREAPSMVFGISTPGPLDRRPGAKRSKIGSIQNQTQTAVPVSRLGGTQFVMDDGDDRYQRATPAGGPNGGPVKYTDRLEANANKVEKGENPIPYNEYFRVRTRTGHQLLMHNSEDLIYIANARGTAWIELSSNGKIDIFASDSVSIHTENDFNFKADRDVNIEAGRNINMKAETGRMHVETFTDLEFLVNNDAKLTVGANLDILVGTDTKISQTGNFEVNSNGDNRLTAGQDTSFGSGGNHKESAAQIHMNSNLPAEAAVSATFVKPLTLNANPATSTIKSWADARYQSGTVDSIMKRVPMHEPWLLHENQAPAQVTPDNTDRDNSD